MTPKFDYGPKVLQQLESRNLLSFGPNTLPLELENLNVLIGPNGAGNQTCWK